VVIEVIVKLGIRIPVTSIAPAVLAQSRSRDIVRLTPSCRSKLLQKLELAWCFDR